MELMIGVQLMGIVWAQLAALVAAALLGGKLLVGEAARMLELSPQRVRELVDRGTLPAERGAMGIRLLDRTAVQELARRRKANRPAVTR